MVFKNFATICLISLHSAILVSMEVAEVDSCLAPMREFMRTIEGRMYCSYQEAFYIFDDELYKAESEKYAPLNKLQSLESMEYTAPIDYSRTHLLAERGIAIVTPEGEINQVATGFIHDCVGVVMRQMGSDDSVSKTLVAHGCEFSAYTALDMQEHDNFNELTDIIDGFLTGISLDAIKVDFVTTYNTDHLLVLYSYLKSKGILERNITLSGNFTADKRPVRKPIGRYEITYFPGEYSRVALSLTPTAADSDPMTEYFWCNYLNCMNLFIDATGKLYPKIKDYLKDAGLKDRSPTLLNHHEHIKLGLGLGIFRDAYCPVPDTKERCLKELEKSCYRVFESCMFYQA